jgi:hypothetical protein
MKEYVKWISVIAVAVALLIILYYTDVINSKISFGIAVLVIAAFLLLGRLLVPPPKEK